MSDREYCKVPVFENGMAMPVFPFTDGKTGTDYDAGTSAIVRYCVYVESDYDMDGDGKRDLVKAFVQVPRSAAEGNYKAATIFEARPYCAGVFEAAYDHMKEVEDIDLPPMDFADLDAKAPARVPTGSITTLEAAYAADPADWYYEDKGCPGAKCYEIIDNYNYYLVRGFAVVASAGFGTLGSDGFEFTGSHYERDAFKCVVEWLHGDRVAYADRKGTTAIAAEWSNGKVAMTGRSYAGTMPFAVAVTGVPGLETIIPVAGIADWYTQQNMQGAQRYWPKEMLSSFLAYYCTSRYHDPDLTEEERKKIDIFLNQFTYEQLKSGFDYSDYWKDGNYTLQAEELKCSALIIHGLHDENVSTKQFEMMWKCFKKAGQQVRMILHQGQHITPTMPNKGWGISIDGKYYDDIVNVWVSHYLYDIENDALDMPAVLIQNNLDQHIWEAAEDWNTGFLMKLKSADDKAVIIDTDWEAADINRDNFDDRMAVKSSNMNQRYVTSALEKEVTIQGTIRVDFRAALAGGDAAANFNPENTDDADFLSLELGNPERSGRQDDVKLTILLLDVADEAFDSFATIDPQRNTVPNKTVKENAIELGGDLGALEEKEFDTVHKTYSVLSRAYIDLCNPASGYEPETAAEAITLVEGEYHDYHAYLNPTRYTVVPGHKLAIVIGTEDPVNCLLHKDYKVSIAGGSVGAEFPVVTDGMDLMIEAE